MRKDSFKDLRCYTCGKGTIRLIAKAGRTAPYKHFAELEIPADVPIPTCEKCGEEWYDEETIRLVDEAQDVVYRKRLQGMAASAIAVLVEHLTQQQLERLLGLSEGYLSKIKSARETPSAALVADLLLLARDPKRRLREIEDAWKSAA